MTVRRYDLDRCIGCRNCVTVCPMDVFRFDEQACKSVIAYPENCQNCGQCYLNCAGYSLVMSFETFGYTMSANRAPSNLPKQQAPCTPVADEANVPWSLEPVPSAEAQ